MELLIPGLILVALMVYASTKIKKSAAAAYEAETIEGDGFSITKPEGFIHPLSKDSPFAFEAYSKEFADEPHERLRKASAEVRVFENADFDEVGKNVLNSASKVVSDDRPEVRLPKRLIETTEAIDGSEVNAFHKLIESKGRVFHLRVWALIEHKDEFSRRIEEMLKSFTAK